ncbi:type VII secretion-associated protein [Corynebacterium appendicis]|uniref:type VII secretion-associated protein n=1 Tax=Corynebacterium appendicis TaxID=163202 RepID=UPI0021AF6B03|nr:type VII secretion-associated protein [Corynebacterium appendicis]MCT1684127.1 type VII secretion-associated protein [Corynebacterium appendicis]
MTTTDVAGRLAGTPSKPGGALLTVTVDDECIVFSGLANVHRYDQPSAGEIVSYIRSVLGENPQWAPVHLVAEEAELTRLVQAFGDYEVELTCETLDGEDDDSSGAGDDTDPHPATTEWEEVGEIAVRRPVLEPRRRERFGTSGYLLVGVVALVAAVCAATIWFVAGRGSGAEANVDGIGAAPPERSEDAVLPADMLGDEPEGEPADDPEPEQPKMEKVTLEQDGLSVELPVGFHLEPDGDMWRATGPDPDFRLQLAVDPLYGVPPEDVMRQVQKDIEDDPELHHTESDETGVRYEHALPDGSHALWSTWTDRDVQISIGCHTRTAPTTVQLATCTMANESARFTPPG